MRRRNVRTYLRVATSLTLLLLLAVLHAAAQPPAQEGQPAQPTVNPEIEAVQTILQTNDPQQRLGLVEKFLAEYPASQYRTNVLLAAAEAHRMQNHYEEAIEYGERALAINPRDAISLILVADSLSEGAQPDQPDYDKDLNRAEEYSRRALAILPELFASVPHRPDVPEEQYKLRENYMEAQVHATLGFVYYRRKKLDEAEKELKLAADMNQLRPNAADYERLGVVQVEQKKYQEAKVSFQRCQELGGPAFFETCSKRIERVDQVLEKEQAPTTPQE
jgi:tetratricopeptide (TPR) repeat protein